MPYIFNYTDYRKYLEDFFEEQKKKLPVFSHRYLAQKLGLSTPNYVLLVMQGKRKLSKNVCIKLSQVFKMSDEESRYFETLVDFMHAQNHEAKNRYFNTLILIRRKLTVSKIDEWQYEYYSKWYNLVVRELVVREDYSGDVKALAKRLSPPITEADARKSIELLLKLQLIKQVDGKFVQSDPVISTGNVVDSLAVANFHRIMAHMAAESFDRHKRNERSISSCTVSLTEEDFQQLRREIVELRKKSLALAEEHAAIRGKRVYQFNFQLFPLSEPDEAGPDLPQEKDAPPVFVNRRDNNEIESN